MRAPLSSSLCEEASTGLARNRRSRPSFSRSEAASALRQLAWRGDLTDDEARGALAELETAAIQLVTDAALAEEAYAVARRLGWAKTYDAEYVALAQRRGCPLLTVDARLARTARRVVEVLPPDAL